jgi:hypothetical protein
VVGIAIFHIKLSTPRLGSFISSSLILQESWLDHYNLILKSKEKSTPPWYMKVGGHPMESASHGLRKENVAYLCFICASPRLTTSTHSYKMKYQEHKVFITTLDPQIT